MTERTDPLIHTKLRLPFTRPGLVARPRLQQQFAQGLCRPLTLITAPAGFGKTTLAAACVADSGMPIAWLSLDKDDNRTGQFLSYLIAALQGAAPAIGREAARLAAAPQPPAPGVILTSLVNDLDSAGREMALVLDDYQCISSQAVHDEVTFLLDHCPAALHLVIVTRSDPPLPLSRLRARGQTVELRAADLRFTEPEAAQFLNDLMGLRLDAGWIAMLAERTEGWIAGLQMAALSMRDRTDVAGFVEGFSGTNRYILDYLLEEVLAAQPPEIQQFLLCTSILERLSAPLCDAVLAAGDRPAQSGPLLTRASAAVLEYLERANLFVVPLDDERQWYRYHQLFADLLRTQLQAARGDQGVAGLHLCASEWYEQNGLTLDAIHHASLAADFERIERLIAENYIAMMNRGENAAIRFWMGQLSKELVFQRPWLCLYEAFSRSWFGQPDEASLLLDEAERLIRADAAAPGAQSMWGYHAYVRSRVTAMQGDTRRAIEFCRTARETTPADNLGLQIEMSITLGYEYFLAGDFENARRTLHEMIRSSSHVRAVNNPVAAYALLARMSVYEGHLHDAYDLLQRAAELIREARGQYQGVTGLVEVGIAGVLCEWNDLDAALAHIRQGLELLPMWGKTDDLCLAHTTLARIQLARGNRAEALQAVDQAVQLVQTCGVFSEARSVVEASRVRMWLVEGDLPAAGRWAESLDGRFGPNDAFQYEDELVHIARARVFMAQNRLRAAVRLLSSLEEPARSAGRHGRIIDIMLLQALALHGLGDTAQADSALTTSLMLAEPDDFGRVFLDEGEPARLLLAQWAARAGAGLVRDYAGRLLARYDAAPHAETAAPAGGLAEPLSPRELEVLGLLALGRTNQEIALQLVVSRGTVKAHTASIYRKLDAGNRTEAVARARELHILP